MREIRGAVFVEALVVVPIMLIFLLGIIQLGLIWTAKISTRYAVFVSARSLQVYGNEGEKAQKSAIFAVSPCMPRITGLLSDLADPEAAYQEIRGELINYAHQFAGKIVDFSNNLVSKIISNFSEKVRNGLAGGFEIGVPLPLYGEVSVNLGDFIPFDEIEDKVNEKVKGYVSDEVSHLTEKIGEEVLPESLPVEGVNFVPNYKTSAGWLLVGIEKFITAQNLVQVRFLDQWGEEESAFQKGDLAVVEVTTYYPLIMPIVRKIMGRNSVDLPDTWLGRAVEAVKTVWFAVIREKEPVRVEWSEEGETGGVG